MCAPALPADLSLRFATDLPSALVIVPLAVLATGCGSADADPARTPLSDAPPLVRTAPRSPTTAASGPSRPTDGSSRYIHVPSVHGLTVAEARLRIGAGRFRVEPGRRFAVATQTSMLARLVPDGAEDRTVTSQLPRRPDIAEYGDVVAVGTEPPAAPGRGRPHLQEVPWTTVRYAAGVLVLDGLALTRSCDRIDHVQLGPRGGPTRVARVWIQTVPVPPRGGCTRRTPQAVLLRPGPDWTRETVAWNGPLAPRRDDLTDVRRVPFAGVTVQPDARTVMVGVPSGGCEVPEGVTITVRGRIASVDARIGATPRPADADPGPRLCTRDRRLSTVMVRLAAPLPYGVRFEARR